MDPSTERILAALVFLALWLNGSFYPLILLPLLFVKAVLKEELSHTGLSTEAIPPSLILGLIAALLVLIAYYPIHLTYQMLRAKPIVAWAIFTDIVWYPVYEEVAYRGFFLGYYSDKGAVLSTRNLALNLIQTALFTAVHHGHVRAGFPLLLIPVFLLGFLNGIVFLRTRSILGCVVGHAVVNGAAMLMLNA
ncbi:MAG: CPBP family intramembrane metalloprotease [Candidatus Bathyarchaeota archaeon]